MPDWVTTWMLTTMAAAGTALGLLLSLLATIELSKELRKWFRPATYPDIVSPERDRDLLESVDGKLALSLESDAELKGLLRDAIALLDDPDETEGFQWFIKSGAGEWFPFKETGPVADLGKCCKCGDESGICPVETFDPDYCPRLQSTVPEDPADRIDSRNPSNTFGVCVEAGRDKASCQVTGCPHPKVNENELPGAHYDTSTAGQVEYSVFGAEYDPAWQVKGPLPVSIPFPAGDNHQQEWEEYMKSLEEGDRGVELYPHPQPNSVSTEHL